MPEFPHLTDATAFPGTANVDVYRYRNEFDYSRWTASTKIKLCQVPWCGDYENAVKFADDASRDAWFDSVPGESFTLETMVHIKPDASTKLPIPIGVVQRFNYIVVDLPVPTSPTDPIAYEGGGGKRRFFYFLDDAVQGSPSTTACYIRLDMWTTFINDLSLSYVILDRGHAPMAAVDVDAYLADPISNCRYLLAPDDDFDTDRGIVRGSAAAVLNSGDMWAVLVTYAAPGGTWGSVDGLTATVPSYTCPTVQGLPAPDAWAIDPASLSDFMGEVDAQAPQFKSCVKCVFFIARDLVTVAADVRFCGHTLHLLTASESVREVMDLDRGAFGYPEPYASIAKLYTFPYAAVRLTSDDGATSIVRVEDTTGTIRLRTAASLVFPWINVDGSVLGIGGADESLTFQTGGGRTYTYGGAFADHLMRWDVPVYSISQQASVSADWGSAYDRAQAATAASNARASSLASNAAAETNAGDSASNITAHNAVAVAMNNSITATANATASQGTGYSNATLDAAVAFDNDCCTAAYEAELAGLAVATANNNAQAAAGAANTAIGVVSELASGDIGGAIATGLSGAVNTATSWSCANAANAVSQSNSTTIYASTVSANRGKTNNSISFNNSSTNIQNDQRSSNNTAQNNASTSIASNNANLTRTNASNTRDTADANAQRAYATATSAISNGFAQRSLAAPYEYGARSAGMSAATRPMGLFAQVVTERDYAIAAAGDAFLRYGYRLGQQWQVSSLQVMPHFTYWKCSEVRCSGAGTALESAQQAIKDIMTAGVTVWSDPEEIGQVSIYDNV